MGNTLQCVWLSLFLALAGPLAGAGSRPALGPAARALVQRAFADLGGAPAVDHHAHLVGLGHGCEVDPAMLDPRHPVDYAMARTYLRAGGVTDLARFDEQYVGRLVALARDFGHPLRIRLLAFDRTYRPDGTPDPGRTEFFVPNGYVLDLADRYPDLVEPVLSVHPFRPDALAQLEAGAARGARCVKWLPNAMAIDPADSRCDPFYRRMAELGLVLLCHTGTERAVNSAGAQALGNPLRLRRALDAGVTVIAAHCASVGRGEDLDHPGRTAAYFDLWLRLMAETHRGRLYGDLSAVTLVNHDPARLRLLLNRPDLHGRLVNGTDWPLPAVGPAIWTSRLVLAGLITLDQRRALNEIARANPMLFDFVLKRTLVDRRTGARFPPAVFLAHPALAGPAPVATPPGPRTLEPAQAPPAA